jgi:hypothetical protein
LVNINLTLRRYIPEDSKSSYSPPWEPEISKITFSAGMLLCLHYSNESQKKTEVLNIYHDTNSGLLHSAGIVLHWMTCCFRYVRTAVGVKK